MSVLQTRIWIGIMRIFRIIFVSLIAVGVCGVVYVGLTAGLAAYMRYKTAGGKSAETAAPAAASAAQPAEETSPKTKAATARPAAAAGVEDVASLMRRKWTAGRPGLTVPPAFATEPHAMGKMLVPAGPRSTLPPLPLKQVRGKFVSLEQRPMRFVSGNDLTIPVLDPTPFAASALLKLPASPALNVPSPDPAQVRVASIGTLREPERPTIQADPGAALAEQMHLIRFAPLRLTGMPFVKLSIPDPTPNSFGQILTIVPDDDAPMAMPERPAIKFATK